MSDADKIQELIAHGYLVIAFAEYNTGKFHVIGQGNRQRMIRQIVKHLGDAEESFVTETATEGMDRCLDLVKHPPKDKADDA